MGRKRVRSRRNSSQLSGETPDRKGVKHRRKCPCMQDYAHDRTKGVFLPILLSSSFPGQFFLPLFFSLFVPSCSRPSTKQYARRRLGVPFVAFRPPLFSPPFFAFPSLSLLLSPSPLQPFSSPLFFSQPSPSSTLCFLTSSFPAPFPHFFNPPSVPTFSPPPPFLQ